MPDYDFLSTFIVLGGTSNSDSDGERNRGKMLPGPCGSLPEAEFNPGLHAWTATPTSGLPSNRPSFPSSAIKTGRLGSGWIEFYTNVVS